MLEPFLPADRCQAMVQGIELPDRTTGTVLIADISGFSTLADALVTSLGAGRGAEELSRQVNLVYEAMIEQVDKFGGVVIGFSGDAITCWYSAEISAEAAGRAPAETGAALRAVRSASAIHQAVAALEPLSFGNAGPLRMRVTASIASGATRRFLVGDPSIQLFDTVAGAPLVRVEEGAELTEIGEIVVDADTLELLADQVSVNEWRVSADHARRYAAIHPVSSGPTPATTGAGPATLDDNALRPWVLTQVYDRLASGSGEFMTELRVAVALFIWFEGIDYEDAEARDKLDRYVRWVQQIAIRYGGAVMDITIGDKGSYLYVSFGAPVANEDDSSRAAAAALLLRSPGVEFDFIHSTSIGISQGVVRAGVVGGASRRAYTVLGDEVNVAARLMQRADDGEVLITKRVRDLMGDAFSGDSLETIVVKGKPEPIPVFRLHKRLTDRPAPGGVLAGREAERALIANAVAGFIEGGESGGIVFEGEAGIGKSRLIEMARDHAQSRGLRTVIVAGDPIETATPYHVWRGVLGEALGFDASAEPDGRRRVALDRLGQQLAERAPLLNAILPFDFEDTALTRRMTAEVRATNTRALLAEIVKTLLDRRPQVLMLEDAHRFDSLSWALALELVEQLDPVLVIVATRSMPEPVPAEFLRIVARRNTAHRHLDALEPKDVGPLVADRLGHPVADPLAGLIYEASKGHPLFALDLAGSLQESQLIEVVDGEWRLAAGVQADDLHIPDNISALITSRIDQLIPQEALTLKVASVFGTAFLEREVEGVYPVPEDRNLVDDWLQEIEHRDFTLREPKQAEVAYRFKHALTQEAAYGMLLFQQRRSLHKAVAEWYEQAAGDEPSAAAVLAHHWELSGNRRKAVHHLEQAGRQALDNYANAEAATFFRRALVLAHDQVPAISAEQQARWELFLGEALVNESKYGEAEPHLTAGLKALGFPVPASRVGGVAGTLAALSTQIAHRSLPASAIEASGEGRELLSETVRAATRLGEIYYFSNDQLRTLLTILRTLNAAEKVGPSPLLAESYASIGLVSGAVGLRKVADFYTDRALASAAAPDGTTSQAFVWICASLYNLGHGEWDRARDLCDKIVAAAAELGDRRRWSDATWNLARISYFAGDFERGLTHADRLREWADQYGMVRSQIAGEMLRAYGLVTLGRYGEALDSLATASELDLANPEIADKALQMNVLGLQAVALVQTGSEREARAAADEALQLAATSAPLFYDTLDGYTRPAEVYAELGDHEGGDHGEAVSRALAASATYAKIHRIGQPTSWRNRGRILWHGGHHRKAQAAFEKSLNWASRLNMPFDSALAHYELGSCLGAAHPDFGAHMKSAMQGFEATNMKYYEDLARTAATGEKKQP